jgi:hypothetical protein
VGLAAGEALGGVEDLLGERGEQRRDGAEAGVFGEQVDRPAGFEKLGDVNAWPGGGQQRSTRA